MQLFKHFGDTISQAESEEAVVLCGEFEQGMQHSGVAEMDRAKLALWALGAGEFEFVADVSLAADGRPYGFPACTNKERVVIGDCVQCRDTGVDVLKIKDKAHCGFCWGAFSPVNLRPWRR